MVALADGVVAGVDTLGLCFHGFGLDDAGEDMALARGNVAPRLRARTVDASIVFHERAGHEERGLR